MKNVEYKLPAGVHPLLEPVETGRTPDSKDKNGNVIAGKPIYEYRLISTSEAETLEEFIANMVDQGDANGNTLSLAQAQRDIIIQRKIRERAQSTEVDDMFTGKDPATKDLSEAERFDYVMADLQQVSDDYRYGARGPATGGGNAAAKAALNREKAIKAAAEANPEVAARLAALDEELKALGIQL